MLNNSKKSNRLIHEKSPYLLQHAYNPVDWYSWGEEAFQKAAAEDKLIFLSIGYATCHWCHVMERESFEDESTAELLNSKYVSIKIDREERPDIDKIYMDALHAMKIQGGWPLNMFLTPDKKPVAGGTYFPPEQRYGRKSFKDVLNIMDTAWHERKEEIETASNELTIYLQDEDTERLENLIPGKDVFQKTFELYENFFDAEYAGFKTNHVNKFPPSMGLSFLLRYYIHSKDEKALQMVEATLVAMKKGGIYDQVGGGLSRYSTDHKWLVPHFEKMLYDNSLFLQSLAECYSVTRNSFYKDAAMDIIQYINRDMKLSDGGIASAEDADSEGIEGKFYVWSRDEFRNILGQDAPLFEEYWNVTEEGNFEEANILNEAFHKDFLKEKGLHKSEFESKLKSAREKLLEVRSKRIRPLRDDKIITSWNALYIKALTVCGIVFGDDSLISDAEKIYEFIYKNLFLNGRLLRRYREGEARFPAYLNDYAELASASLALYSATFKVNYFQNAVRLTDYTVHLFSSELGAFYETGSDAENLIRRSIDGYDGVEPSGNSTIAQVFLTLAAYGVKTDEYRKKAEGIFTYFAKELRQSGISYPAMLSAFLNYKDNIKEIAVIGDQIKAKEVLRYLNEFLPGRFAVAFCELEKTEEVSQIVPLLADKKTDKPFQIYVCEGNVCKSPVGTLEKLRVLLN